MPQQELTYETVLQDLEEKFPEKTWNEESIYRWCCQVNTVYIADPDSMVKFLEVPIKVIKGKAKLPENLYKLLDVFDNTEPKNPKRVRYNRTKTVLKGLVNYDKDVIWINFVGTALNKDCIPLIDESHLPACESFCKINGFESDMLYGEINQNLYMDWKQRFDGQIQGCKSDIRDWTAQTWEDLLVIHGNEIPKIGSQPLANNYTGMDITQ